MFSIKTFGIMAFTVTLAFSGAVSAQTVTPGVVTTTFSSATTAPTPGTSGVTFGTIQLSGNPAGTNVQITSLPVTLALGNGATVGNLSNCQLFNSNGVALNNGVNTLNSLQSGSNTMTFDTPLVVPGGSTTILSLRCNVASSTPLGGTFAFGVGATASGTVVTTSTSVVISTPTTTIPILVTAGAQDAVLAMLRLDATQSTSDVLITQIPISLVLSGGANSANLSDCRVRNTANWNAPISSGVNVGSGSGFIPLTAPLTIARGTVMNLALTCDIAATTVPASIFTLGTTPSLLVVTTPAGLSITGAISGSTAGVPVGVLGSVTVPPVVTPGVPNTGSGGDGMLNFFLLALALGALVGGITYAKRTA